MARSGEERTTAASVSVRELSRNTSRVLAAISASDAPALVTSHGRIVAAIVPVDAGDLADYVLARASQFVDDLRLAEEDIAAGRTRDAREVLAELQVSPRVSAKRVARRRKRAPI